MTDEAVRRQLAQLFGESLFGRWPELEQNVIVPKRRRWVKTLLWQLTIVGSIGLVLWGGHALFKPGLSRQDAAERAHYAVELQTFLNDGALVQAAQYLPLVYDEAAGGESRNTYLDLTVYAEAVLYRYFDADPARLLRISPHLEGGASLSPLRQVARLTLVSREERATQLSVIEQLGSELPNNNQVEYLRATALEFRGNTEGAIAAWSRSAKSGPAWSLQRFEQASFEAARGDDTTAKKVASQIVRTDPDSDWSKLAIFTFGVSKPSDTVSERTDASAPITVPVEVFYEKRQRSIEAHRLGDITKAKELLLEAASVVNEESPFLLDAFDWLLMQKAPVLAQELTKLPKWPGNSPVAKAKLERLVKVSKSTP